ncbi:MAG TPA: hypothetical protein VG826_05315 [Pirellulales bacterium]|nr:hypothetical protein [Pirellulales bacterium]
MSLPATPIGQVVYVTDPAVQYQISGLRLVDGVVIADLVAFPNGRPNVENVHAYDYSLLTVAS